MSILASRGMDQYPIRFPEGMREEIKAAAVRNGRSMNSEILSRLSTSGIGGDETLRDRVAMAALDGIIASSCHPNSTGRPNENHAAQWAYEYADAMLEQRQKGGAR